MMGDEGFGGFVVGCFISAVIATFVTIGLNSYWREIAIKYDIGSYNPKTSYFELKSLETKSVKEE